MTNYRDSTRLCHVILKGVVLWCLCVTSAQADNIQELFNGITLKNTRVIYPHSATNGVTYSVTNNTTIPYLLQARIISWQDQQLTKTDSEHADETETEGSSTFIALPPLKRFESEETLTLRIRQKHNLLAQDRETLEVLSLTAIPAQADPKKLQSSDAQLSLAIQNNIKLFYRPAGLPEYNIDNVEKQLQFSRTKTALVIKNPTPFYVTFNSLRVGNAEMNLGNSRMMAPFSESRWPLDNNATDEVHWQLINDQGGTHDANHRRITQIK